MPPAVSVSGLRELNRALARASKEVRAEVRDSLREVAEPVRATAEQLAEGNIRRIGPRWAGMRIGTTSKLVYVAPKQRGRRRGAAARPNLAGLLATRAMEPALQMHQPLLVARVERALDKMEKSFDRGV